MHFVVKAIDRATKQAVTFEVTQNENIRSQEDAERHVAAQPGRAGGPSTIEVIPAEAIPEVPSFRPQL